MPSEVSAFASDSEAPPAQRAAMERALDLARRGWGRVAPNPLVGAVVLAGDTVVGEGYHAEYGGPHAEVVALEAAGARARGATLVVNLEPCAHHGKTPPCTDAIVAAGVAGVVAALPDPDPQAPGRAAALPENSGVRVFRPTTLRDGLRMLRDAGVQSLLCEGGGALGARLLADGLVDRLYWVQAPVWLGEGAVPAFPGVPPHPLAAAPRWTPVERRALGSDTLLVLDRRLCLPGS